MTFTIKNLHSQRKFEREIFMKKEAHICELTEVMNHLARARTTLRRSLGVTSILLENMQLSIERLFWQGLSGV